MTNIVIVGFQGKVEVLLRGRPRTIPAVTNLVLDVGDRLLVPRHGRLVLQSAENVWHFGPLSDFTIKPRSAPRKNPGFEINRALLYFFHRGDPADTEISARTVAATTRGTEFNLEVSDNGRVVLTMLDGEADLSNLQGRVRLAGREQGVAEPGQRPQKSTAVIEANQVIQWALYYPAILNVDELSLTPQEEQTLADSLAAYRAGALLEALAKYPEGRQPGSAAEKIYFAALLLAVGQVEASQAWLNDPEITGATEVRPRIIAEALFKLVAAIKFQSYREMTTLSAAANLATVWMAESYYQQSRSDLTNALTSARNATRVAPNFGFGWARTAEMEFSFGRVGPAMKALDISLHLAGKNPEAFALEGYLAAAQNRVSQAIGYFEEAISLDDALGNAWLGRGLCLIRKGNAEAGRRDLLVAAALEPQRAVLRSYLSKAYSNVGDTSHAYAEIRRAKELDEKDPTSWLYSALLNQQNNRINEAIRDLEKSQDLNDNRSVYRSRFLLDQDRAVRSANLAVIYRDAGMLDLSLREAGRAVNYDYGNYSAHLFLANSYDQLRDPRQINLRYETAAVSEYLLANLLAPVGAGMLSQTVSQQEYSKLLERDRFGVSSTTEYFSNGAWMQNGAQFGTFGNSSYAVEALYRSDPGERANNDFEQRALSLQLKQQLSPADTVYFQGLDYYATSGDVAPRYNAAGANPGLRTKETQEPILVAGYHHEWSPGSHTLILATRLSDTLSVTNPTQEAILVSKLSGTIMGSEAFAVRGEYRSTLDIYTTEIQQIWQQPRHAAVVGARFQTGDFNTRNMQRDPPEELLDALLPPAVRVQPPEARPAIALQEVKPGFQRFGFYGYYYWTPLEWLQLVGGLSYDQITFPKNFRFAPVAETEETSDSVSPKLGLIWRPGKQTTVRAAYGRSLAGASLDQSFRLEPSQVAGFNQAFRSIIPEAIEAANAGAQFENFGVSVERKLFTGTYVAISGEILNSDVRRSRGTFERNNGAIAVLSGIREELGYQEKSLAITVNQLIGNEWSVGAGYRISQAVLEDRFPEVQGDIFIPPGNAFSAGERLAGTLSQVDLRAIYNHPSGLFAQFQTLWTQQSNQGYQPDIPGDDFWQYNLFAGYRFPRRKAELMVGLLNVTDQDYKLNPLNLYTELPHTRTFMARLRFNF